MPVFFIQRIDGDILDIGAFSPIVNATNANIDSGINDLEVIDNILYKRGPVFKKKAELYKLAELNRVYSYFRW